MKIKINDISLNYKIYGEGRPLLFIHGNALNIDSMDKVYEPLLQDNQQFQRIYLDLPGMGESPSTPNITNSDEMLAYIIKFIDALNLTEPLALVGHSYGGYLSIGLAHKLQEKVAGLYLTCPVVYAEDKQRRIPEGKQIIDQHFDLPEESDYLADYLDTTTRINQKTWDYYINTIVPGYQSADEPFMDNIRRDNDKYYKFSFEDDINIANNTVITLLLGKYDNVVGYQDQVDFFTSFPKSSYTVFSDAGHNFFIDLYDFNKLFIDNFLQRLTE
ncbi:alpha/beta hydrolase [Staphylococcus gallinarum]|uniref:alpha/beta fold hydrolase n=1 Tax=Staphylococcus gallinarum TaxID=1293 RepID=UPI001E2D0690|nr:alpha/beta hydrolase [Staphylococcus gallinarum]MCD8786419.1 alpha/beta hydrolase [Staphylococcus gallinarum]MCD8858615.1 alpha/beta hydrolase [Staphylococcus gallinarum]